MTRRAAAGGAGAPDPGRLAAFLAVQRTAEAHGGDGRRREAAEAYRRLVPEAQELWGAEDRNTLAVRHQLAHWTGESGLAGEAVAQFERLLADRVRIQGPDHADVLLARHQLAHWYGRAGDHERAVERYRQLHAEALRRGHPETAVDALVNAGYWQREAGETAAALRSYAEALRTAERELGSSHPAAQAARQRYAELAGGLPLGHAGGAVSLESMLAAALAVSRSGDRQRAERMFDDAVAACEEDHGDSGEELLGVLTARARAAAEARDWDRAHGHFGAVLACLQRRGEGPGTAAYDLLAEQREQMTRMTGPPAASPPAGQLGTERADQAAAAPPPGGRPRMSFNPDAEAIGDWQEVKRAAAPPGGPAAFGRYRVLERVGAGGFGQVYLCTDPDGVLVAVKTLHAEYAADAGLRTGFAHEVAAARRVASRFTVPVTDADTEADTPWMAVPFVAAPSLHDFARQHGPLDEAAVRAIGAGIAHALAAIHAAGIVHLDLKPGNVLLTPDGPRVIDFGIAQIERLTQPRQGFTGTYAYASPEQLRAQPVLTPASDVFSLGTLLAGLALGRGCWRGAQAQAVAAAILAGAPDLDGLPPGLRPAVLACLAPDPAARPAAADVAQALTPGTPERHVPPPPLSPQARELLRRASTLAAQTAGRRPRATP